MAGLCMAIPTSRKGATRHQLTQLKKFVMENGFGHSTIQVDNEPAIIQLAEVAARELGLPWRHSTTHTSRTRCSGASTSDIVRAGSLNQVRLGGQ
eukprot:1498587-Amphidinium_carterae.1